MLNISFVISFLFMIVPVRESTVHACFHIKLLFFSESIALTRITTCSEQELFFRIIAISTRYECETCQYELHFVVCFSSEKVLQNLPKNNRTKKQIDAEIQVTLKRAPARKRTEDKMFCRLSQQITKLNYKLTLLASECLFHKFCYLNYLLVLLFQSNKDNLYQVKR